LAALGGKQKFKKCAEANGSNANYFPEFEALGRVLHLHYSKFGYEQILTKTHKLYMVGKV
jgi:hypothetical protein